MNKKELQITDKVIYSDLMIKPSQCKILKIEGNIATLDNRVQINTKPNSRGGYNRIDRKSGIAMLLDEETQKVVDACNFYHQFNAQDITYLLRNLYGEILHNGSFDIEKAEKILYAKKMINRIFRLREENND